MEVSNSLKQLGSWFQVQPPCFTFRIARGKCNKFRRSSTVTRHFVLSTSILVDIQGILSSAAIVRDFQTVLYIFSSKKENFGKLETS